jgi:uncharacterized membrane protein required for colicin V production
MWLNFVAGVVLAACIASGAWRGAIATGLGLATMLLSYGAAIALSPALAPAVSGRLGMGGLAALAVAGTGIFAATALSLGLISRLARNRWDVDDNDRRLPRDRWLGGSFGALRGALLALLVVYVAMWFDALRATGTAAVLPEIGESAAAEVTSEVVESAVETAVGTSQPLGRFAARVAARPAASTSELKSVLDDPRFARLRNDADFWGDVERGDLDSALYRASFLNLSHDAQLRHQLADLGLVSEEAATDAVAFRKAVGEVLAQIGPHLRGLRSDPAVQELLSDPKVVAMIQDGDTLGLLAHPGFRALVDRISSAPSEQP